MSEFTERYGPWALIAGGAQGIGEAYARYVAAKGVNLVLLDMAAEPLQALCAELTSNHGVDCLGVTLDLAAPDMLDQVIAAVGEREIGLVIYNAAIADVGPFYKPDSGLAYEQAKIAVNVTGPLLLTYHFARPMLSRGHGGVLLMSSGAGLNGAPYHANYSGTKAYAIALAESLYEEFKPYGVDVMACIAGMTLSTAAKGYQHLDTSGFQTPTDLVEETMAAFGQGPSFIAGEAHRQGREHLDQLPRAQRIAFVGQYATESFMDGTPHPQNLDPEASKL
ncbi:MAG: SDR family NAD(P)-dependent oxidoreductase [Halieaceae bacterium]|jgi:short-subunit dehydrogenase|nr:SDR family NAD(P)-dependent oxidoreductase [Halieaceae bacterium]